TTFFLRVVPYRSTRDGSETSREPGEPDLGKDFGSVGSGRSGRSSAPDGVMVTLTDISALDHARARIYQLSAIVESADAAIIGKDLEGTITSWNRGAERLYGFTAEEVVGRNIKLLAPPEREEEIDRILETIRRGNAVEHIETMRVRKDGRVLHVSVTVSPIHDREGTIVGASAIARDVTPLRRAQVELEEREARIRLLLDST